MVISQEKVGKKTRKYNDHLIEVWAKRIHDTPPHYGYGYGVYKLKPYKVSSFNPKISDCLMPARCEAFGYVSDKLAIRAAQKAIDSLI